MYSSVYYSKFGCCDSYLDLKVCDCLKYYFNLNNYAQFANFWQIGHTKILIICQKIIEIYI